VEALAVVDLLQERSNLVSGVMDVAIGPAIDLLLQGSLEPLGLVVVKGIADPAHAGLDVVPLLPPSIGVIGLFKIREICCTFSTLSMQRFDIRRAVGQVMHVPSRFAAESDFYPRPATAQLC
jgi:hypothetical protein